uniref:Flavin-containing monooxygenase n=1 Tax=Clastoptera arizonana TaxID=38151 RepID=A0A1B6BYX0_9HEMI
MRVGIVGAGPAGLSAAKHATIQGLSCTVFEQSSSLGGTWVYTDKVGHDEYGLPIHTSMYRDLRVNIPKEIVHYPDFPHKANTRSYITSEEVLKYLNDFADFYNLRKYIQLKHYVMKIRRKNNCWSMRVIDLPNKQEIELEFDAIFVCNGYVTKNNMFCIPFAIVQVNQ